jgi:hypothetical protein
MAGMLSYPILYPIIPDYARFPTAALEPPVVGRRAGKEAGSECALWVFRVELDEAWL